MHVPTPLSRVVLTAAIVLTVVLAWSAWRTTSAELTPQPAQQSTSTKPITTAPQLTVAVDATDLGRGLLRSTITCDVRPGRWWLRFPCWLQGTHAPCGAVENICGLIFHDEHGSTLPWSRDPHNAFRFGVQIPVGVKHVSFELIYLANQATVNSQPVDVLDVGSSATINWNDCLLYPEGWIDEHMQITASLRLPTGWHQACALDSKLGADGVIAYDHTDLRALIDSPILCGRNLDVSDLTVPGFPIHRIAVTAPTTQQIPPRALAQLSAVAAEAREIFGAAPFTRYTWLLGVGENFPHLGLEHLSCSLNGLDQDTWFDSNGLEQEAAFLLTHEYGHAWCGKHHRPAGMAVNDCHTYLDTRLLWVYEGFDQYIGMLLAARSGSCSRETWIAHMALQIAHAQSNRSRTWRTLEDTASISHLLRQPSKHWRQLRGSQDYYLEGMLLCFEADGLIRRASHGKRSFDDVLRRFLAPQPGVTVVPYSEADVIACLHAVEPSIDWTAMIDALIHHTTDAMDLTRLHAWGMQATWSSTRAAESQSQAARGYIDDRMSIGVVIWQGKILDLQPGSPADQAHIAVGDQILRVNGQDLDLTNWENALSQGVSGAPIQLHLSNSDGVERDVPVTCTTGPRYLHIAPSTDADDRTILDAIIAPRSAEAQAVRTAGGGW